MFHTRLLTLCLLLLPLPAWAEPAMLPTAPLAIQTSEDKLDYTVEIATTAYQQEQGLMNRTSLPDHTGMIFVFSKPRQVVFWMKDTLIPLDMLFIDNQGLIQQIVENAKPMSTDYIPGHQNTRAVIEVAGGSAQRYHIAVGNRVIYSLFP